MTYDDQIITLEERKHSLEEKQKSINSQLSQINKELDDLLLDSRYLEHSQFIGQYFKDYSEATNEDRYFTIIGISSKNPNIAKCIYVIKNSRISIEFLDLWNTQESFKRQFGKETSYLDLCRPIKKDSFIKAYFETKSSISAMLSAR